MPRNWGKRPIIQYKNGQKILPEHSFMQHLLSVYYVPSISLTAGDTEVKQISLPLANLHLNRGNVMNKIKKIYILWDSGKALLRKIKQGRRLGRRGPEAATLNKVSSRRWGGTSLVVQWLRIRLPMQGTRVWALVQEIPHAVEQLSPCATTTKPAL